MALSALITHLVLLLLSTTTLLPVFASKNPKRGIAFADPSNPVDIKNANTSSSVISWQYNWASSPPDYLAKSGIPYIPMQWGTSGIGDFVNNVKKQGAKTILGFNEPDLSSQSNINANNAAVLWKQYINPLSASGVRLGAPAVTSGPEGRVWLTAFLNACSGCKIDFIPLHWYGTGTANFYDYLSQMHTEFPNYPLWVTEYASTSSNPSEVKDFLSATTKYMDSLNYVERYSWFAYERPQNGFSWTPSSAITAAAAADTSLPTTANSAAVPSPSSLDPFNARAPKKERRKRPNNNGGKRKDDSDRSSSSMHNTFKPMHRYSKGPASPENSSNSGSSRSIQPSPTSATPRPPSRVVDEDYDEGVADALMGLASYRAPENSQSSDPPSRSPGHGRHTIPSPRPQASHRNSISSNHASPPAQTAPLKRALSPGPDDADNNKRSRMDLMKRRISSPSGGRRTPPEPTCSPPSPPSSDWCGHAQSHASGSSNAIALPPIATLSPSSSAPSPANHNERDDKMHVDNRSISPPSRGKLSEVVHGSSRSPTAKQLSPPSEKKEASA
ncbi:hypothetical protein NLJ89_g3168 [Agrocybe chaxingu]|uniref:Asl1-like glycosyl hydrolase catalytic domain-containing protein n=1 Tax=Agrocybe chaxingu TaxID=84603 RepID=A0A9W8KBF4_9AGAR|nr:hypothetical protein NLJ89_g3168 [Agrocybe chaxingu]